ncbi:MAG: hypothetical protein PHI40_07235, partial [Caldisericia bacterium]|nr:hypothetical protein [Caldisericia bacterium]
IYRKSGSIAQSVCNIPCAYIGIYVSVLTSLFCGLGECESCISVGGAVYQSFSLENSHPLIQIGIIMTARSGDVHAKPIDEELYQSFLQQALK